MPKFPSVASRMLRWSLAALAAVAVSACQQLPEPPEPLGPYTGPGTSLSAPASPSEATFAFEPFTGAPGNIADDLSRLIGNEAQKQGLTLVRRVGASATYRVNGYLTSTGEPSSATVFYVFDVVDGSGNRRTRITGSETVAGTAGDPWVAVESTTLERIANRTVVELKAWLNRQ